MRNQYADNPVKQHAVAVNAIIINAVLFDAVNALVIELVIELVFKLVVHAVDAFIIIVWRNAVNALASLRATTRDVGSNSGAA
ncbi:MAG: hypothetical protein Q7L19_13010 [Pseudohongiella sp.]|nr:hypothetical protein [Pseudohongiella sp.]